MKLIELPHPDIVTSVRYRILSQQEIDTFLPEIIHLTEDELIRTVLENIVFNLKGELTSELRGLSKTKAKQILFSIYNGCIMLNPGLDIIRWQQLVKTERLPLPDNMPTTKTKRARSHSTSKITRNKIVGLEDYLREKVIGQDEAISTIVKTLKRSHTGLGDVNRPLGVFLFAGPSGVGKTHLAKTLQQYLFDDARIVRIDCGEYQHRHENAKLLGSPAGYVGYDDSSPLVNNMLDKPNTVVLLDEVEKAHPDIWHTFLSVFDEGMFTAANGKEVSFRNAIIIMTSNLGNKSITEDLTARRVGFNNAAEASIPREKIERIATEAIRKHFNIEFLNRIDKTVVFNHLSRDQFASIAELEMAGLEQKLTAKGFSISYDSSLIDALLTEGVDKVSGARGLSRIRRERLEAPLAELLLGVPRLPRETIFNVTYTDGDYKITPERPIRRSRSTRTICASPA